MKNLIVKILIGLPASGKSTWAKSFIKKNENWVIVSRDSFRYMLTDSGVCDVKIEKLINDLVYTTAIKCLNKKQNVILDATNLKAKYINDIIKVLSEYADIDYFLLDTSLEKCLERDKNREKSAGERAIMKMNRDIKILKDSFNFQPVLKTQRNHIKVNFNSDLKDAVCFDIDGTLALMGKRSPYDWDKVDDDDLNEIVAEQIKFHKSLGRSIIIISGRDGSCKKLTEDWLSFYGVEYDEIFMKKSDDFRKDNVVKKELYNKNIKGKYNVLCVYDDRNQVVKMWYDEGIFCFNVNQGMKEF